MSEREELERLRKLKRLRELEAKVAGDVLETAPDPHADSPNFIRKQDFAGRAANAALFNFGDEISAAGVAAVGGGVLGTIDAVRNRDLSEIPRNVGEVYGEVREGQRSRKQAFERENPGQALAADALGAVVGGGKVAGAVNKAAPRALSTKRGATAVGATEGAAFATGAAEGGVFERADDAATGAIIGGVGGAAFQGIANGAARFWQARRQGVHVNRDLRKGFRILVKKLARDKGSRGRAEAFLRNWVKDGANGEALALELARGNGDGAVFLRSVGDLQPGRAFDFVERQKESLRQRTVERVRNVTTKDFKGVLDDLADVRVTQARPLFEAANQTPVPEGFAEDLITRSPDVRTAFRQAERELANVPESTPFEVFKVTKENLDDRVGDLIKNKPAKARRLRAARDDLRQRLVDLSDDYRQALSVHAGTKATEEAMEIGLRAAKSTGRSLPARQFASQVEAMKASGRLSELEFARLGMARGLLDEIDNAVDGRDINKIIRNDDMRNKIRVLFADAPDEAESFIQFIREGRDMFDSLTAVSPRHNSQTVGRAEGLDSFRSEFEGPISRAAGAVERGGIAGAVRSGARSLGRNRREKVAQDVADALSEFLFEPDSALASQQAERLISSRPDVQRIPVGAELNAIAQNRE